MNRKSCLANLLMTFDDVTVKEQNQEPVMHLDFQKPSMMMPYKRALHKSS